MNFACTQGHVCTSTWQEGVGGYLPLKDDNSTTLVAMTLQRFNGSAACDPQTLKPCFEARRTRRRAAVRKAGRRPGQQPD